MAADPRYVIPVVPSGFERHPDDPPSSGGGVIPAAIITTVIALIVVCMRMYTRLSILRGLPGVDDYLVIVSMCLSITFMAFSIRLAKLGCGIHGWDMLVTNYSPPYLVATMGITLTYCTSVSFAKLSILSFYLRLSPERMFRAGVFFLIGITCTYTAAYIIVILLVCRPVAANWDISLAAEADCFPKNVPMMVLSVANILIDFAILLIPVHVVVPLQMPRRQKMSLILLFATGGFVCAAAIYRTWLLPQLLNSTDYTWDNPPQQIWGSIEANAGIFCASVPTLKPFFTKYLPFILSSRFRSGDRSTPSGFNALSTKAERNRKRRQDKSYELSSRDKGAPTNSFPAHDADDEAALWTKPGQTTVVVRDDSSTESNRNQRDKWSPGSPGAQVNVSTRGHPTRPSNDRAEIHITKETKITYDRA